MPKQSFMPFKFEKLEVWKEAMDMGEACFQLGLSFPPVEQYNLSSQLRRAADSIALNIAEGSSASSNPEQVRFLNIAVRSCNEVVCCLHKAKRKSSWMMNDLVTYIKWLSDFLPACKHSEIL